MANDTKAAERDITEAILQAEQRGAERMREACMKAVCLACHDGDLLSADGDHMVNGGYVRCRAWAIRAMEGLPAKEGE